MVHNIRAFIVFEKESFIHHTPSSATLYLFSQRCAGGRGHISANGWKYQRD